MKKRRKKPTIKGLKEIVKIAKKEALLARKELTIARFKELSDEELASACAHDNQNAWLAFEERFRPLAFYICGYWSLGAYKEEIWQDSLLILLEKIKGFKEGNLSAYIARIVYYKTREKIRELKKQKEIFVSLDKNLIYMEMEVSLEKILGPEQVPEKHKHLRVPDAFSHFFYEKFEENTISRKKVSMINKALKRLPQNFRKVMKAYYFDDLNVVQISRELKIPLNTVLTRLKRARAKLLEIVKKYYPELLEER